HVVRGALASNSGQTATAAGLFGAYRAMRIIEGASPSELPQFIPPPVGIAINEGTALACNVTINEPLRVAAEIVPYKRTSTELLPASEAVGQALLANPGYQAKLDIIKTAEHSVRAERSNYFPQVELRAEARRVDNNSVTNSFDEVSNGQYFLGLSIEQKLFSPATKKQILSAKMNKELEAARANVASLELERAVHHAYLGYLQADERILIESDIRRYIDRFLERAFTGNQLGILPAEETLRWETERFAQVERVAVARADLAGARARLNLLLGRTPEILFELIREDFSQKKLMADFGRLRPVLFTDDARAQAASQLVAAAILTSPELVTIDSRLALEDAQSAANRARYWPEISVGAQARLADRLADRPGFDEKLSSWTIAAKFDWSLFDGGKRRQIGRALDSERSAIEYARDQQLIELSADLHISLARLTSELISQAASAQAETRADEYFKLMVSEVGVSRVELLDGLHEARKTRLAELRTRFDYHRTMTDITRLIGWSPYSLNALPHNAIVSYLTTGQ
ncbi:MAG: TolC family protein, partial [candidate division Zixibacteria bacterium]